MPVAAALPFILPALGGIGGAIAGSKGSRTSTSMTTPADNPSYAPLFGKINSLVMDRLNNPSGLPAGFENMGISGIDNVYKNITQSLNNKLSSQGLYGSPVAGNALATGELNRAGDVARFETSLPTIARAYQDQDLNNALGLLRTGQSTTAVGPGSAAGGALGGFGSMLGYLTGKGAIGGAGGGDSVDWSSVLGNFDLGDI